MGFVEISTDGGITFTAVGSYVDNYVGTRVIDISQYAGRAIKMRFRIVSDLLNGTQDPAPLGWFIQNIAIASDDFHTIGSPGPNDSSLSIIGRPNGTYYYRVASEESNGKTDGVKSTVSKFTTPAPGERIAADPKRD